MNSWTPIFVFEPNSWARLNSSPLTAGSGVDTLSLTDSEASGTANFYRVEWIEE